MANLTVARALRATSGLLHPSNLQVVLTQQHLRMGVSQLLSLRSYAADQQADRKDAAPDPFLPHLQHKTEKELLDLLSKNQQQISRSMLQDDDDDDDVEVPGKTIGRDVPIILLLNSCSWVTFAA